MTVDIEGNLNMFLRSRAPGARYASFDYCFNHFQEAREAGQTERLADKDLLLSCLQLGFYLASWGMMRGSGDLLQRTIPELEALRRVDRSRSHFVSTFSGFFRPAHQFFAE